MSDDGRNALTLIAFIGSVFSPFYFRARRRDGIDPRDHCAINVALYGGSGSRWAFTEYPRTRLQCQPSSLVVGANALQWDGSGLRWHIAETTAPIPGPVTGVVRLYPQSAAPTALALDHARKHWWRPIAPRARVEVEFARPALRWSGTGYFDTNQGSAPLDEGFHAWSWQRAHVSGGTAVVYDLVPKSGAPIIHSLLIDHAGELQPVALPPRLSLPASRWGIPRATRAERGIAPRIVATLEDAPFYARTLLDTTVGGERALAIHESLSLDRFRSAWVRALLPFRMRRSRR